MKTRRSSGWAFGVGAVALVVCCAFPLLLTGLLAVLGGIGLGSWLLVGAGLGLVAFGIARRRIRQNCRVESERRVP